MSFLAVQKRREQQKHMPKTLQCCCSIYSLRELGACFFCCHLMDVIEACGSLFSITLSMDLDPFYVKNVPSRFKITAVDVLKLAKFDRGLLCTYIV